MTTDWNWVFTSESGRDNMLRDRIDDLSRSAAAARNSSARLSSQLSTLQGSIEARLSALSRAFDAYVELGDLRERLDRYPDTGAIRNEAYRAIEELSGGGQPRRVDDRGTGYWLAPAVNALTALSQGDRDVEAEQAALGADPEAVWFGVTAAGALGHGVAVGDQVAPLLTCDEHPSARQRVLWQGVLAGLFGAVVAQARPVWSPQLETDRVDWRNWIGSASKSNSATDNLRWLAELTVDLEPPPTRLTVPVPISTDPEPIPADPALTAARDALRTVVLGLIDQGMGDEGALLERARLLRRAIENPGAGVAKPVEEPAGPGVTDEVRTALLAAAPGSANRRELLLWIRPLLAPVVEQLAREAATPVAVTMPVNTKAGRVEVGDQGAAPADVARAEAAIAAWSRAPWSRVVVPAAIAGAFAVLAFVVLLAGHPRGALLLLLAAIVAGLWAGFSEHTRRGTLRQRQTLITELHDDLSEATVRVQGILRTQQDATVDAARDADTVRSRLPTT